jgi:hypothetical protein
VAAQIPPSVSIAWKNQQITGLLAGIASLEANRGSSRALNTSAGIATLITGQQGGIVFEAGVNTSGVSGQTNLTRTRMGIYIAKSAVQSWYPFVDAPNVPFFQQDLMNSAEMFLGQLVINKSINPGILPYIMGYNVLPTASANTPTTIAAGQFNVAAQVQLGSSMSQIILSMQYGETVVVSTT